MANQQSSQMLKGILQGCILYLISREELYGYSIGVKLSEVGFGEVPKGTIYPLLLNLEKKELIEGYNVESKEGPMRKYYRITRLGLEELEVFRLEWKNLKNSVNNLLEGEKNEK